MHHAGCTTNISDLHARRVLGRKEYRKFVDFYDRSVLGEGIHCLKCGSFVNLPRDGDPMVQCPYCAYRWCVRCKCPLDPGQKSNFIHRRDLTHWLNSAQVAPEYQVFRAGRRRGGGVAGSTWRAALPRLLQAVHKSNSRGASATAGSCIRLTV